MMDAKQLRDGDFFDITGAVFKMFKESWEAFKLNWQVFVTAFGAVFSVIILGGILAATVFGVNVASNGGTVSSSAVGSTLAVAMLIYLLAAILIVFIAPLVITAQLASARGKKHTFSEFAEVSKSKVLGFLGLALLMALTIGIGFVLLFIPGLLAIFFLTYAPYIYIDKKIGVVDAMKASYELTKEYWKVTAGIFIVNLAVSLLSRITFIGALASFALSIAYFCLGALVYVKIAGKAATVKEAEVVKATPAKAKK